MEIPDPLPLLAAINGGRRAGTTEEQSRSAMEAVHVLRELEQLPAKDIEDLRRAREQVFAATLCRARETQERGDVLVNAVECLRYLVACKPTDPAGLEEALWALTEDLDGAFMRWCQREATVKHRYFLARAAEYLMARLITSPTEVCGRRSGRSLPLHISRWLRIVRQMGVGSRRVVITEEHPSDYPALDCALDMATEGLYLLEGRDGSTPMDVHMKYALASASMGQRLVLHMLKGAKRTFNVASRADMGRITPRASRNALIQTEWYLVVMYARRLARNASQTSHLWLKFMEFLHDEKGRHDWHLLFSLIGIMGLTFLDGTSSSPRNLSDLHRLALCGRMTQRFGRPSSSGLLTFLNHKDWRIRLQVLNVLHRILHSTTDIGLQIMVAGGLLNHSRKELHAIVQSGLNDAVRGVSASIAADANDYAESILLREQGDLDVAAHVGNYLKALTLDPTNEEAYDTLVFLQKFSELEEVLREAVTTERCSALVHMRLGQVRSELGKRSQALQAFLKGLSSTLSHHRQEQDEDDNGKTQLEEGAMDEAIVDLFRASGPTPIHLVAYFNRPILLERVITRMDFAYLNTDTQDSFGATSLHWASFAGHCSMISKLLSYGAMIDAQDRIGWTPLFYAAMGECYEAMRHLVENGADVNKVDRDGRPLLFWMLWKGDERGARILFDASCGVVRPKDLAAATAAHFAILGDSVTLLEQVVKRGGRLESTDMFGFTPLHWAAGCGSIQMARFLVEKKGNSDGIRVTDVLGATPVHWAARGGHLPLLSFFHKTASESIWELCDQKGATPLHWAASSGHTVTVVKEVQTETAVAHKLIRARDHDGCTPLHFACQARDMAGITKLVEAGAMVDARNSLGETVLHLAARQGMTEAVSFLLAAGADALLCDALGRLPLARAMEAHLEMIDPQFRGARITKDQPPGDAFAKTAKVFIHHYAENTGTLRYSMANADSWKMYKDLHAKFMPDETPLQPPPAVADEERRALLEEDEGERAFRVLRRWFHELVARKRRDRMRRVVLEYVRQPSTRETLEKKRMHTMKEIISTERTFLNNVNLIMTSFFNPLRASLLDENPLVTKDEFEAIFSRIADIQQVNTSLLKELENEMTRFPTVFFGCVINRWVSLLDKYSTYIANFGRSITTLGLCKSRPAFARWLQEAEERATQTAEPLDSLLIKPVQRVSKYELLLRDLLKYTHEYHVEYKDLKDALDAITVLNGRFNEKRREVEEQQRLCTLSSLIADLPDQIVAPWRVLLMEEDVAFGHGETSTVSDRHMFLFNDLLLVTKKRKVHAGWRCIESVSLCDAFVQDSRRNELEVVVFFQCPTKKDPVCLVLRTDTIDKKQAILETLSSAIDKSRGNREQMSPSQARSNTTSLRMTSWQRFLGRFSHPPKARSDQSMSSDGESPRGKGDSRIPDFTESEMS